MLKELSAETIHLLNNGIVGAMIDQQLRVAIRDLDDRGEEDGKPRTVTIKLHVYKSKRMGVQVEAEAHVVVPAYRSAMTSSDIRIKQTSDGPAKIVCFRDDNAENVDQPTFNDHK